jgi:hypothetical protein
MNSQSRLVISIGEQKLRVFRGEQCVCEYAISTSAKGEGFEIGSFRTPTGRFRISEKIGDGEPPGTIFKCRVPVGLWSQGEHPDEDLILTRILRLDGLDDENLNTMERCIYIHGTNREDLIGEPVSHGCIRLANDEMLELFGWVERGDAVEILSAVMSSKQKKSAATGVRYTDAQKKEVISFVVNYNKDNGRGGQNEAAKKFNLSVQTVSAWLKAAGKKGAKGGAKKASKR